MMMIQLIVKYRDGEIETTVTTLDGAVNAAGQLLIDPNVERVIMEASGLSQETHSN